MTHLKSYTSLEQSKVLAEILSLESAVNAIVSFGSREGTKTVVMPKETLDVIRTPFADIRETTMCWSLAALLSTLPNNENISTNLSKGGYRISTLEYTNSWFVDYEDETDGLNNCVTSADNPVDACYEMILKLHELKMLNL